MGHGCVVSQWVELLANQWVGLLACSGMAMHAISGRGHVAWHWAEPLGLEWGWLCDLTVGVVISAMGVTTYVANLWIWLHGSGRGCV